LCLFVIGIQEESKSYGEIGTYVLWVFESPSKGIG
jgi:hypothetical protein